jgi:hypothetical protein
LFATLFFTLLTARRTRRMKRKGPNREAAAAAAPCFKPDSSSGKT